MKPIIVIGIYCKITDSDCRLSPCVNHKRCRIDGELATSHITHNIVQLLVLHDLRERVVSVTTTLVHTALKFHYVDL